MSYSLLAAIALTLPAHVGGIPTLARFDTPVDVGNVADQSFTFTWQDNEMDLTGLFGFFFQRSNLPPNGRLDDLAGDPIVGAEMISISDTANAFTWDTTGVPAGSYYLYAITTDSPLPQIFSLSRGVTTVQHGGDPLFPAVVVDEPNGSGDIVANAYPVQWRASGVGPLTATISFAIPDDDPLLVPPVVIATDVPMVPEGDHFVGCYLWDLGDRPGGYHYVLIEVRDAAGRTHSAFSRGSLTVYRDPAPVDAGPVATCSLPMGDPDAGAGTADGGVGGDDEGPGICVCRAADGGASGRHGVRGSLAGGLALLLTVGGGAWVAGRTRTRR